jgi:hypothetical protein
MNPWEEYPFAQRWGAASMQLEELPIPNKSKYEEGENGNKAGNWLCMSRTNWP